MGQPRVKFGEVDFRPPHPRSAPKRPRDGLRLTLERQKSAIASPFEEVEVFMWISITRRTLLYRFYTVKVKVRPRKTERVYSNGSANARAVGRGPPSLPRVAPILGLPG